MVEAYCSRPRGRIPPRYSAMQPARTRGISKPPPPRSSRSSPRRIGRRRRSPRLRPQRRRHSQTRIEGRHYADPRFAAKLRIAAEWSGDVERLCTKIPPADHNPESNPYLDCGGRHPRGAESLYVPERSFAEEPTILPNELSRTFITDIKRSRPYLVRLFKHQSTRFVQA